MPAVSEWEAEGWVWRSKLYPCPEWRFWALSGDVEICAVHSGTAKDNMVVSQYA